MEQICKERKIKIDRILEEYSKRKSQNAIAEMFDMSSTHVSWVTQENNFYHTLNLIECNPTNRTVKPGISYEEFCFLDRYPVERFM